jgi:hypothetical protein
VEIKIKTDTELKLLFEGLSKEIVDASIYHRLLYGLFEEKQNNNKPFNESNTFWYLTFQSLNDARLIRLCRVYDTEATSLNIVNLLKIIKANLHLFSEENLRKRLGKRHQDNAIIDSLVQIPHLPSPEQLEKDIKLTSCQNPIVKKLIVWRNSIVAHTGAKTVLQKNQILADNLISKEEVEKLLDQSIEIFNRYSSMYDANLYSRQIVGHDDYKSLLKFVNLGLDKFHEGIDAQIAEAEKMMIGRRVGE